MATNDTLRVAIRAIIEGAALDDRLLKHINPIVKSKEKPDEIWSNALAELSDELDLAHQISAVAYSVSIDEGPPKLAIRYDGKVLACNKSFRYFQAAVKVSSIDSIGVSRQQFLDFKKRLLLHGQESLLKIKSKKTNEGSLIFIGYRDPSVDIELYILQAVSMQWSESVKASIKDIFGLTSSEHDVLLLLAQGFSIDHISTLRSVKASTVRQQVKVLLQKTETESKTQAATLVSALSLKTSAIGIKNGDLKHQNYINDNSSPQFKNFLNVSYGEVSLQNRIVSWKRYGRPGGTKILLMHSLYFGVANFVQEVKLAEKNGLDILCVVRPGYGNTSFFDEENDSWQGAIEDSVYVQTQLNFKPSLIVCHDHGLVYALRLINAYPQFETKVLSLTPVPLYRNHNVLNDMSHHHRLFVWTAMYAYSLLKLLIPLGASIAKQYGPERWLELVFDEKDSDYDFLNSRDGKMISEDAFEFNYSQSAKGHGLDLKVCISDDWTHLLTDIDVDLHLLAGSKNKTFSISQINRYREANKGISIDFIKDAGLPMTITHTEDCFKAIIRNLTE